MVMTKMENNLKLIFKKHIDDHEKLYEEFKEWMKSKNVTPNQFRSLFRKYYDEFVEV